MIPLDIKDSIHKQELFSNKEDENAKLGEKQKMDKQKDKNANCEREMDDAINQNANETTQNETASSNNDSASEAVSQGHNNNNEHFLKDIFDRIRNSAVHKELFAGRHEKRFSAKRLSVVLETDTKADEKYTFQRRHPVLQATLSHDMTLTKKSKKAELRRSLDERILRSGFDFSMYSAKEREILAMVLKNEEGVYTNDSDLEKAKNLLKPSFLSPRKFIQEIKNVRTQKNSVRKPSNLGSDKEGNDNEAGSSCGVKGPGAPKKANIFKRFIKSASEKLPTNKVISNSREGLVNSPRSKQRKYSLISKKSDDNEKYHARRPSGNLELHAMLQEEYKHLPGPLCSSSSTLNMVEKVEQARMEYANEIRGLQRRASGSDAHKGSKNVSSRACIIRANSVCSECSSELNGTFFEEFEKFKRDPFQESK